jgi:hypothetical protein
MIWLLVISGALNVASIFVMRYGRKVSSSLARGITSLSEKLSATTQKLATIQREKIDVEEKLEQARSKLIFEKGSFEVRLAVAVSRYQAAERRAEALSEELMRLTALPSTSRAIPVYVAGLDARTKALVKLAVDNPSEKEGAAAAMIVCKKLKSEMR